MESSNQPPPLNAALAREASIQAKIPKMVQTAVMLLYISLGTGVLVAFVDLWRQAEPYRSDLGCSLFGAGVTFLVMWFFISRIEKGRNWARITFLILFLLGTLVMVASLMPQVSAHPFHGAASLIQTALQTAAFVLLFLKPSSEWFLRSKSRAISGRGTETGVTEPRGTCSQEPPLPSPPAARPDNAQDRTLS